MTRIAPMFATVLALSGCDGLDQPIADHCATGCETDDARPVVRGLVPSGEICASVDFVEMCAIAAGGHDQVIIDDLVWLAVTSGPFRITTDRELDGRPTWGHVHADAPGDGVIESDGYPNQHGVIAARVTKVSLVPPRPHQLAHNTELVWHVSEPEVAVALRSGRGAAEERRLVDASLTVVDAPAGTSQPAWDVVRFATPRPGTHPLVVAGDSFPTFRGAVTFVDRIERLALTVAPTGNVPEGSIPVRAGAFVCAHAFTGVAEVYAQLSLEAGPDVRMLSTQSNCREVIPDRVGPITITVRGPGVARTFEFTAVELP